MSQEVSAQVLIDIPLSAAWEKLRDISLAHHYVPGIVKTVVVSQQRQGVGASRYVYRNATSYIQETVEEWQEGHGFRIRLHRGDKPAPPFRNAQFRYDLAEASPSQTRFTASLTYELPWGRFGAWLGTKMANTVQRTIADVAIAMKLYYETGRSTTAAAIKVYKAQLR